MKKVILLGFLVFIIGCSQPSYENKQEDFILPPELSHCSIYRLSNGSGTILFAMTCDNRKTVSTVHTGKNPQYSFVVE